MSVISDELSTSDRGKMSIHSSIQPLKILAQSGQTAQELSATGIITSYFNIGGSNRPLYLDKTRIRGYLDIPLVATISTQLHHQPAMVIRNIKFVSSNQGVLIDLPEANNYCRSTVPYHTSSDEFEGKDTNLGAAAVANAYVSGSGDFHAPSGAITTTAEGANTRFAGRLGPAPGLAFESVGVVPYREAQYVSASAAATARQIPFDIPLSDYPDTVLAYSGLFYSGNDCVLQVDWAPVNDFMWKSTLNANETANAASGVVVVVRDIHLMAAVESNPSISNKMINDFREKGLQLVIPYVNTVKDNHASEVTSQNYQMVLTSGLGQRLLAVVGVACNVVSTLDTTFDISNLEVGGVLAGNKISVLSTALDSVNLQQNPLNSLTNDDYSYMKKLIANSSIATNSQYQYNKIHVDSWRNGPMVKWQENNNKQLIDGLDLSTMHTYSWTSQCSIAKGILNRFYVITQKHANFAPDGTLVVS